MDVLATLWRFIDGAPLVLGSSAQGIGLFPQQVEVCGGIGHDFIQPYAYRFCGAGVGLIKSPLQPQINHPCSFHDLSCQMFRPRPHCVPVGRANLILSRIEYLHSIFNLPDIVLISLDLGPISLVTEQGGIALQYLLSEVCTLVWLILVMPTTHSVSERSFFSTLCVIKNYVQSTMSPPGVQSTMSPLGVQSTMEQFRLNNVMILNVHKDRTD